MVCLIEGQPRVERSITGRRNPGRERQGREADFAGLKRLQECPVDHEARGWRLERDR